MSLEANQRLSKIQSNMTNKPQLTHDKTVSLFEASSSA